MTRALPFVVLLLAFFGIAGYVGYDFFRDIRGPEVPTDPKVAGLVSDLQGWDDKTRVAAVERLGDLGSDAAPAVPNLVHAIRKGDEELRVNAVLALGRVGKPAVPPLVKALDDKDADVRYYAVWAIGLVGPEAAEPAGDAVVRLLDDPKAEVRRKAAESLGRMAPAVKDAVPALAKALQDSDTDVQAAAANALAAYGAPAVKELRQALEMNPDVRSRAIAALGKMRREASEIAPALVALLQQRRGAEDANALRAEATQALVHLGKDAVPALTAGLADPDQRSRAAVVGVLVQLGPDGAAVLADALKSEHVDVRRLAAQNLGSLGVGDKLIVLGLAAALKDPDRTVRLNAAYSLGNLGPDARPAVSALEEAARGNDRDVPAAAAAALRMIRTR